jgi:predicted  nucleic acid-binding Zn-ribbon protein
MTSKSIINYRKIKKMEKLISEFSEILKKDRHEAYSTFIKRQKQLRDLTKELDKIKEQFYKTENLEDSK